MLFRSKFSDTPLNVTLEIFIDATARCSSLFSRWVAHVAAFLALPFPPQVADPVGNPGSAGARVEVNRAASEVLVCTAVCSVLHLIVERQPSELPSVSAIS